MADGSKKDKLTEACTANHMVIIEELEAHFAEHEELLGEGYSNARLTSDVSRMLQYIGNLQAIVVQQQAEINDLRVLINLSRRLPK